MDNEKNIEKKKIPTYRLDCVDLSDRKRTSLFCLMVDLTSGVDHFIYIKGAMSINSGLF